VAAASAEVTARLADRRDELAARLAVVRGSPALEARERAKHAGFEAVLASGLQARGVDPEAARLLARVTVACYDEAVDGWLTDPDPHDPGLPARLRENLGTVAGLLAS
jgi:hypothetical protein